MPKKPAATGKKKKLVRKAPSPERKTDTSEFARIYEKAPVMMCLLDDRFRVLNANAALKSFLGRAPDSNQGESACSFLACAAKEDGPDACTQAKTCRLYRAFQETLATGKNRHLDSYHARLKRSHAGTEREIAGSTALVKLGGKSCIILCLHDITAFKATEYDLRQSETRFKKMFEEGQIGIAIAGLDFKFIDVNPVFCRMFGYTAEEFIGLTFADITPAGRVDTDRENILKVVRGGMESYRTEKQYRSKDGELILGSLIASPIRDENGRLLYFLILVEDISERKRVEQALRASEERFRSIFENSTAGVALIDLHARYLMVNRAFCNIYGYTREELLTMDFYQVTHPDDRELTRKYFEGMLHTDKTSVRYEKRYVHKDGHTIWAEVSAIIINDQEGKPAFSVTHVTDLTERRRAEQALRESEERNSIISSMTTDYAFIVDVQPDGAMQMRWISDSYTLITGRTIDEVKTGDLWKDVIAAEDWARFLEFMKWVIREKVAGEIECRSQRSEQHRTWLHIIVHPKLDAEGRLIIIGAVKDISWRKKAEEALSAEKERLAVTLRSIGDGVITTDTSGRIMLMNKIAEELTGWTHEEAQGRSLADVFTIINPLNRKICENPVALALSTRTTIELPTPTLLIRRDGREFMIADSGAPIKDRDGKVIGVVLVFRDMTEKNRLLEAAQKTQKLESLGILAGGIAHDFNNLLVGIYGYIDMARDQPTEARTSAFLDAAIATIGRAQSLTHQLLTFAKGGAPIRKTSPLFPFIKETVQFALSGSAVTCRFEVEPDLLLCDYDPNQLGQVIDNIVINAEQSMPAGGSIVIIAANRELHDHPRLPDGQYVAISIRDTGSGIPREIQERIFDPFFTTKQKGSGLGLAIAYSIITKHNGLIELESEPGRGSTFHIILPASSGHEPQPSPGPAGLLRGTGAILLMDDEKMILDTVGAMLKSLGFSVVSVQDGVEALRAFHEAWQAGRPFTAVILDLTIPGGMGGRETVKEIRQTDAAIPVFVMSGYADDTSLANAAGLGFTDGIQKPFIRAELSRLLSRYLPKK